MEVMVSLATRRIRRGGKVTMQKDGGLPRVVGGPS